jgi:outer membrane protein assembly factor BamD (BamD/ComL family)
LDLRNRQRTKESLNFTKKSYGEMQEKDLAVKTKIFVKKNLFC